MSHQHCIQVASLARRIGACTSRDVVKHLHHLDLVQAKRALVGATKKEYLRSLNGKRGAEGSYIWSGLCNKEINFTDVVEVALKGRSILELAWVKIAASMR